MAASEIEIVNQAIVLVGATPIASLEESTKVAITARVFYPMSRDEVLRAHPWNFAIKRVHLSPLQEKPAFGYSYAFQIPPDWLRTLEISVEDYAHEDGKILCNESGIDLRYVFRNKLVTAYDSLCASTISYNLAAKLALPLTSSQSIQQSMWQMYTANLSMARVVDAQEDPSESFTSSSLLEARY